jgi:uncharacterized protein YgbK (DUF1537 family)
LAELCERQKSLHRAALQLDAELLIAHAHAMAGMAAEYGMARLENGLRALIEAARQTPETAAAMASAIDAEVGRSASVLRATLNAELGRPEGGLSDPRRDASAIINA